MSIGFLNAITEKAYAYIKDNNNNSTRKEVISPLTNYNVISLSQQLLNDYSSISFLNANVNRSSGLNSNAYALVFDLFDNKRNFNFKSNIFGTNSPRLSEKKGFRGYFSIQELKGNLRFGLTWEGADKFYNQNELGFFSRNDFQSFSTMLSYRIFKEFKNLRSYTNYLRIGERFRFNDGTRTGGGFRFGNNFETKNLTKFELHFDYTGENKDFYETRSEDRYFIEPENYGVKFGFNTNGNNTFSYGLEFETSEFVNKQFDENKYSNRFSLKTKYRISNKVTFSTESQSETINDDVGFLQKKQGIYFQIF